jgi:hypothetical protein
MVWIWKGSKVSEVLIKVSKDCWIKQPQSRARKEQKMIVGGDIRKIDLISETDRNQFWFSVWGKDQL